MRRTNPKRKSTSVLQITSIKAPWQQYFAQFYQFQLVFTSGPPFNLASFFLLVHFILIKITICGWLIETATHEPRRGTSVSLIISEQTYPHPSENSVWADVPADLAGQEFWTVAKLWQERGGDRGCVMWYRSAVKEAFQILTGVCAICEDLSLFFFSFFFKVRTVLSQNPLYTEVTLCGCRDVNIQELTN